jgi:hypothetical protein
MAAGDISVPGTLPTVIGVRGARHNNLRDRSEAQNHLVSTSPEQVVGHAARAGHDLEVELVKQLMG